MAMDKLHIFLWAQKNEKLMSVISHIVQSHYPQSGNVHVILLKFKMANTNRLLNICDRKKSNLIYGGGWYRISGLLFVIGDIVAHPLSLKNWGNYFKKLLQSQV